MTAVWAGRYRAVLRAAAALALSLAPVLAAAQSGRPRGDGAIRRESLPLAIPRDTIRGDSAAFATLPTAVRQVLDVRTRIGRERPDPNLVCVPLSETSDGSRRQRLQGRIGDSTSLVVFARVDRAGALARVEFVRRLTSGVQHGYTWERTDDVTTAMEWPAGSMAATSYPVPRGGPIPRAVRALGRLVMTWPCPASDELSLAPRFQYTRDPVYRLGHAAVP